MTVRRHCLYFYFFFDRIRLMKYLLLLLTISCLIVALTYTVRRGRGKTADKQVAALDKAKAATLESQIRKIADAVDSYYEDQHEFPENLGSLVPRYLKSADDLIDSWGTQMTLKRDGQQNLILISAGKDRIFDSPDDVERRIE